MPLHGPLTPLHRALVLTPSCWCQQLPVARRRSLPLLAGAQLELPHVPHHGRGIESLLWGEGGDHVTGSSGGILALVLLLFLQVLVVAPLKPLKPLQVFIKRHSAMLYIYTHMHAYI